MIAAIKDSESNNPDRRILADVIFSFLKTPEATADQPDDYYREIKMEPVQWHAPIQ